MQVKQMQNRKSLQKRAIGWYDDDEVMIKLERKQTFGMNWRATVMQAQTPLGAVLDPFEDNLIGESYSIAYYDFLIKFLF